MTLPNNNHNNIGNKISEELSRNQHESEDREESNQVFFNLPLLEDDLDLDAGNLSLVPMPSIFSNMNDNDYVGDTHNAMLQQRSQRLETPTLIEILDAAIEIVGAVPSTPAPNRPLQRNQRFSDEPKQNQQNNDGGALQ